ncbi:hypothetical protein [Cellulomonas sp. ES6]|uniref:hypothetical protein n=1 Tax=Cellulomonas sp. ES6 TaxID=3039384 RepID=UPI0024B6D9EA|nr:hypothetical protein [Cellulomonas sp. ES6]WHP18943.1 hypothetical protein P9841_07460 [Cellulomonas sp. ES6]
MNHDLDAALHDLAAGAAAAHRARAADDDRLVLAPTVRRVRRRRRVRGAAATTGGLAVVAALVAGGFALAPEPTPQPAGPTPTTPAPSPSTTTAPSPSGTPTADAEPATPRVVLPAGDPALPFGSCGSLASATPQHPVTDTFEVRFELGSQSVPAGGNAEVRGSVAHRLEGSSTRYTLVPSSGPELAVLRDGVVVATGTLGGDDSWELRNDYLGEYRWAADWMPLSVCGPEGQSGTSTGAPLPAGSYEVLAWADVVDLGTSGEGLVGPGGELVSGEEAFARGGTPGTAVGAAVPLTITGAADRMEPVPGAGGTATLPAPGVTVACRTDVTPSADPPSPLGLEWSAAGTTVGAEELTSTSARIRYTGEGRLGFYATPLWVLLLSDGQVVGSSPYPYEPTWRPLLATGTAAELDPPSAGLTLCDGSPVPPGRYEALVAAIVLPDGDGTQWSDVVSARATVVVD